MTTGVHQFQVSIIDSRGFAGSAIAKVTVNIPNPPPTANAGTQQTISVPVSTVTLTGNGTANNGGSITGYEWTQVNGTAAVITNPNSATTTVTGLTTAGVRIFRLTVTDNVGGTASATVSITVNTVSDGKTIPGRIEAESWNTKSGPFYAVATNDPTGGVQQVIGITNGSWMDYNVNVAFTGMYTVNFRVATSQAHAQFQVKKDNTVLATVNIPSTGDWINWATVTVNNVALTSGTQTLRILSTNNESCNFNWMEFISTNVPPTATAGLPQTITLPVSEVTLTGTGTGNNGATIASYAWTRVSGPNNTPALNIVSPTTASTSVTGLVQGTYVFRLTVTDNLGGTGIADVTITVNQPPTADAGTTQTILVPLSQVLLTGSGTSGNGGSLTYAWTRVSGPNDAPNLNIVSASAASTLVTGLIQGSYVFRLTITNTNSATATSDVSVIVAPGPPTVSAGSTKTIILPASSVTVTGTATPNNGGSITGYTWTKTSGPAGAPDVTIETPTTASTLINGLVQGDYIFQLLATQDDAQTASSQVTVHVIPPIPPTANAGTPQTIALPASQVTLTGTGTPGNGGTITYAWTRVSGPNDAPDLTIVSPTTASTSVTGLIEGVYIFKLTVTNNDGGTATSQVTITVIQAPTANAGAAQTIQLPVSQVSLSGSGTSGNGGPITYAWTRVSGPNTTPALSIISPSSANTQVTGLIQGVYVFRLTVSNNVAMSVTSDVTVTVYPAPTANAGATQIVTLPTNQVTLSGNGTAGNGGTITYAWTRVSGPNNTPVLNIVSPTSATTLVTGMVQGVYVFRLTVTNNDLVSATSDVTINVNPLDPTTPYGGTRRPIPGKLEAEEYDGGGQGISYNDANAANLGGALRTTEGVDLRTCPDVGGGYAIGWTTDGEWVKFSVNVITSGIYDFAARIASPNTGKSLQFQVDGVTTGTLNIANTGGFNNWQTVTLSNISLTEGYHIFRFLLNTGSAVNTDFGFDINWFNFILTATTAPTANAGSTQTIIVPASQVTLSGTGTAATNKTITGYAWTRVSGPNNTPVLSIVSSNTASTQVTGMVQGTYVFRLTVTQNDNQTATSDVTVNVVPPGPPTANAGIAQAIQLPTNQISLSGSGTPGNGGTLTYGWTRVSGPNNTPILSIVSPTNATTLVTGMVQGTYVFRLTVTQNDDQTATSDVTITVNPENLSTPYGGTRKTIPGKLEAEEYDLGGQNLAYNDGTTINSGSAFRLTEGVDVRTCPDVGGGYAIGWTTDGEWMKYSVNVTTSGIYDFSIRAASPNTGKSIQFQVDGATAGTLTVANSGGFNNWQTSTLTGIPLTSGNHTFRFLINSGNTTNPDFGFDINWFNFVLSASTAPVANAGPVQTIVLPTSQVTLTGSGIPGNGGTVTYVWTRVSGPNNTPALSIVSPTLASTSVTGLVFGTYVFRLTVTQNDNQTSTSDVTINVVQPGPPTASAGSTQTITLPTSQVTLTGTGTAGNGGTITYAWTRVSGPNNTPALNIVSPSVASTQVTGMVQGTYVFRLTVTQNDLQTATSDVTINVNPLSNGKTIPGKIEAESWDAKSGPFYAVATADVGGGQQVIGISNGSWMDYNVNVTQTGTYSVGFRVATTQAHAQFQLKLGNTVLGTANVPNTGDWGNWATLTVTNVALTAGAQTLRIISTNTESCNFNWVNFAITSAPATTSPRTIVQTASSATEELIEDSYAAIFPNPVKDKFTLKMNNNYTGPVKVQLFDQAGRLVKQIQHTKNKGVSQLVISTNDLFTGLYIIKLQSGDRIELIKMIRLE
ncbi:MAG: carbohydrate-binding protein [Chitinophagaceae bacterium]